MAGPSDLSHITGACAGCKRENLSATDIFENDIRRFLEEQSSSRGKQFTDARAEVHTATKAVQVAGASLFCSKCVVKQRDELAATDEAWNDGDDPVPSMSPTRPLGTADAPAAGEAADSWEEAADSWEDL